MSTYPSIDSQNMVNSLLKVMIDFQIKDKDLADAAGMTQSSFSRIKTNHENIRVNTLDRLLSALGQIDPLAVEGFWTYCLSESAYSLERRLDEAEHEMSVLEFHEELSIEEVNALAAEQLNDLREHTEAIQNQSRKMEEKYRLLLKKMSEFADQTKVAGGKT